MSRNSTQQVSKFQVRGDLFTYIKKQLQLIVLVLRTPQIQTIVQRECDDTPDQVQEAYFLLPEWIYCLASEREHTQSPMRCGQWHPDTGATDHFLRPWLVSWIPLFSVP